MDVLLSRPDTHHRPATAEDHSRQMISPVASDTFILAFRPTLEIQSPVFTQSTPVDLTVISVRNG
jgi:hypothetical protein